MVRTYNVLKLSAAATACLIFALTLAAGAANVSAAGTNPVHQRIDAQLASGKPAEITEAVAVIKTLLRQGTHYDAPYSLQYSWLPALINDKAFTAAAALARMDIRHNPGATANIYAVQTLRVQALLDAGKTDGALRNAKSLFNVAPMQNTASAVMLLAKCLRAASPVGSRAVAEFRQQELAGEATPAKGQPPAACATLAAVVVHAKAYLAVLSRYSGNGFWDLIGRGNLLLLADKPRAARRCFNNAYDMAVGGQQLAAASDRIAACMKARDGTIGRANAWVTSIRPKP